MKTVLASAAILFALFGILCAVVDWILCNFVLEDLGWEGPLVGLQMATWLLTSLSFGAAVLFCSCAVLVNRRE